MDTPIYRNGVQIEFCDLLEKAEGAGFRPAEVARMLHISKASISKIKQGKQTPRPALIQSLKRLVEDLGTQTYDDMVLHEETVRYADKLFRLPEPKRELAKTLIDQLASDASAVNSTEDRKKVEGIAVHTGMTELANYIKKKKAAKSNGNKSPSTRRFRRDSKSRPSAPTPDPKQPESES